MGPVSCRNLKGNHLVRFFSEEQLLAKREPWSLWHFYFWWHWWACPSKMETSTIKLKTNKSKFLDHCWGNYWCQDPDLSTRSTNFCAFTWNNVAVLSLWWIVVHLPSVAKCPLITAARNKRHARKSSFQNYSKAIM